MLLLSDILFAIVAALHLWFLTLEMFLWETPIGRKTFGQTREQAAATAVLAKNQGLYNGFLAAGLIWGLLEGHTLTGLHVRVFFGTCIVIAGAYGAYSTRKPAILLIQSLPALAGILVLLAA